jgi:hypothetical protein
MAKDSGQSRRRARAPVRLDGPRSAHLERRGRPPELQIRSAFEATRTAAQCLAGAYERLVPIPRRLPRLPAIRGPQTAVATDAQPRPRSAERG